jgi:hypothetical protein
MIKLKLKKYITSKIYKSKQTELIQLSNKFTWKQLVTEVEKLKTEVNAELIPKLITENTELRLKIKELTTPDNLEVIELRGKVSELELLLNKKSDISYELENTKLRTRVAELELQLSQENLESEKLELRKQELDLKYNRHIRTKNNLPHRFHNEIEQKFCPGILCREETGEDGKWLELSCFGKAAQNKDGLRNECKECRSITEKNNYTRIDQKMTAEELKESKEKRSMKIRTRLTDDNKKICSKCNELKDLTAFKKNGKYITGEDKYRSSCTKCK